MNTPGSRLFRGLRWRVTAREALRCPTAHRVDAATNPLHTLSPERQGTTMAAGKGRKLVIVESPPKARHRRISRWGV